MKNLAALMVTVLALCLYPTLSPAEDRKPDDWSGSLSVDAVSQYVGFGSGAIFYDEPMMQSVLCLHHKPTSITLSLWWGTGFNDNFSGGWDDEIDYGISKAGTIGYLTYDIGVGYWDVHDLFTEARNDIVHPYIEFSHCFNVSTNLSLTPFVKWEGYYIPFGHDVEGGTTTSAGVKYGVSLTQGLALTGLTSFGWDDGGFGLKPGLVWKLYADLGWKLRNNITLRVPTMQFYQPINTNDGRNAQVVLGAGVTFGF